MSETPNTTPAITQEPSPAAAPASTTAISATSPPPDAQRDGPVDERIVALRGMFPDYDDLILQSVLESVQWSQERAIDALLGMSDPEYKPPTAPPAAVTQQPAVSQTDLDEQFARTLLLEEQREHQQQWVQQQQQRPQQPGQPNVPYQTRPGHVAWSPPPGSTPQGQSTERPAMQDIQEQFTKIAETGKKTFGTIFSKVKAKIQEFDQPRPGAGNDGQPAASSSWSPPTNQSWTPPPQVPQSQSAISQQAAYYAPAPQQQPPAPAAPQVTQPKVQGYSVTPSPSSPPVNVPQPGAATTTTLPLPNNTTATIVPSNSPPPIDGVKLGLLPKRPVSLLRENPAAPAKATDSGTTSATASKTAHDDGDSDDLEYAESPFEDSRK